ncbi:hypothetical protein KI387_033257 [Taxus chinensis]|uniref:Uncharacterized protein n=1 Tax=Taxus chinensis TaxID=29808 RepID=A0AA38BRL9_TAXCH|nr:hypothetical protein KI387_033257 [Taxus chinensis]
MNRCNVEQGITETGEGSVQESEEESAVERSKTLFVLTYDEHKGFYDHVPSPVREVPSPYGIVGPHPDFFTFDRLGVRVPTIMISPWINKGITMPQPYYFETAFEVDKEVAGAVKLAFSHLNFLPASAITDIFNVNDNACKRVSIKPDEKDFAVFNNSIGFYDLSSESEAQIQEKIVASKVPREPKKKCSPEILLDLGSILVKHVSKLEREVKEAKKLAKSMQSEAQRHSGGLQEHVESLLRDSRDIGSLVASNFEREVTGVTELIKSPQREERISMCGMEREKLVVEGANATKLSQEKVALSKTSMKMNLDLFADANNNYDKENRDVNTASTKTNAYATDQANSENTNNLEIIQNSNFTSTLPIYDSGTNHAMKNASEVV